MAAAEAIPTLDGVSDMRRGALAVLTLDRGGALNALTPAMIARLDACYRSFARDVGLYIVVIKSADRKAFCAGGDVRALLAQARGDFDAAKASLAAEYRLNWLHECFSKPTVAFIDGIVMGSGAGISAYATHRVAGPGYRFAMPETAIGFFPDVGTAYGLSRLPHQMGIYLGLTGHSITRADALALGLVTHCLDADAFGQVEDGLAEAWPVDPLLDERHRDPGASQLMAHAEAVDRCFSASSVEEIVNRLSGVTGESAAFAQAAAADLAKRSPLALKVTLRHLRESVSLDLRQVLETDYRLACRFLGLADFQEGVRAALIDKDQAPRWQPDALSGVSPEMLNDLFATMPDEELNLSLREEMQRMRV